MTSLVEAATARREQALRSLISLPPFSPVLSRLMASLAAEDVSFAELGALIEKDTVLAGSVLRIVNSALYGLRGTVNSVRHAVAVMGVDRLRNFAMGASVARMWSQVRLPPFWSAKQFNLHSVATALLSDLLAPHTGVNYPEGAFAAGLLHDLGKLLLAMGLPDEYAWVGVAAATGRPVLECEMALTGHTHADFSGVALARWNLPEPIQRAVTFHHAPGEARSSTLHLAHVVRLADALSNHLGHSIDPVCRSGESADDIASGLGIYERLPRVLEQFETDFEAMKAFI